MIRLIPVIRVSSKKQLGRDGEGLERQRLVVREVVAELEASGETVEVVQVPDMINVSGSDLAETKEWKEIIAPAIAAGGHLVADSIDRIVRADKSDTRTLNWLAEEKGKIYLPGKVYSTGDDRDMMVLQFFAAVGGYEKRELVRRMHAGKEVRRRKGVWVGRGTATPLGTTFDRETRRWLRSSDAERVRDAFEAFAAGTSLRQVASMLGLTPPGARRLLGNPIYVGRFVLSEKRGGKYKYTALRPRRTYKGRELVSGEQPARMKVKRAPEEVFERQVFGGEGQERAIVSPEVFKVVQERLASLRQVQVRRRVRSRSDAWAATFLWSSEGVPVGQWFERPTEATAAVRHVLHSDSSGEKVPLRYACRCKRDLATDPRAPRPRCKLPYLHAKIVNRALDAHLSRMTTDKYTLTLLRRTLRRESGHVPKPAVERERVLTLLRDLDRREAEILDLVDSGMYPKLRFMRTQMKFNEQRKELHAHLDLLGDERPRVNMDEVEQLFSRWAFDPSWPSERKREWLSKYVRGISISPRGIEAVFLNLPRRDGGMVVWSLIYGATEWSSLVGGEITTPEGRFEAEGLMTAGVVLKRLAAELPDLGFSTGTESLNRLSYLVRSGKVPTPSARWGLKRMWTGPEFEKLKAALRGLAPPPRSTRKRRGVKRGPTRGKRRAGATRRPRA